MKTRLFSFLMMIAISISVFAIPANPNPVKITLSDGTEVTYFVKGDEKVHWITSIDGYTLMYNDTKELVYAEKDADGDLVASKIPYRGDAPEKYSETERSKIVSLQKNLHYSSTQISMMKQVWQLNEEALREEAGSPNRAPVTGTKNLLCILANFSNKTMTKTQAQFDAMMNQIGYTTGGNKGSVKDFYLENSYGQLTVNITVVGPVTLPNTCAYYSPADGSKYKEFARTCAQLADASVNFADYAISGSVPTYHIIFAGYGDEAINNAQQIWSHQWTYTPITLDGVSVGSRYSCSPELVGSSGSTMSTVGVVCHEMCHAFGAPDYYDTDYAEGTLEYNGTGYWDLMASGSYNGASNNGSCPAHINMHQKIIFGWVNATTLTTPYTVTNQANSAENAVAYIMKPYTNNEMYVIENRQKLGFDSYVPGAGMLIWHIHNSAATGSCNNTTHPQQVYPVCASATTAIPTSTVSTYGSINSAGCPFPGTSSKTSFTGTSTPRLFRWNGTSGTAVTDKDITEITHNTSSKTVSWKFMGGGVAAAKDAEITAITSPTSGQNLSSTETVIATLKNNGSTALTSCSLRLYVDNALIATEAWTGNLAQNATANRTFTAKANLSAAGNHTIAVKVVLAGDEVPANDSLAITVKHIVCGALPLMEFFEDVEPTNFQSEGNLPDCWLSFTQNTSYPAPHVFTSGGYSTYIQPATQALLFVSGNAGNNAYAIMPEITNLATATLTFSAILENATYGQFYVGYVTDASSITTVGATFVSKQTVTKNTAWRKTTCDLSTWSLPAGAQIAFRFTNTSSYYGGAIDSVNVVAIVQAPGCGTVNIANWAYGDIASNPVLASTCQGITGAVVTYLGRGTTTYAENANAPTNVGTYTVKAVFPATVNYNAYSATAEFEITKKNITKPTLVQSSFVYNGNVQTVALNVTNAAYTLGGTYSATNANSYTATVTLNDIANTQWADGSTTALNLSWAITTANGCGTVNIANWVYGDIASNPVLASTCQGITGAVVTYLGRGNTTYAENANAPTNAGIYTVKAVFPATTNYTAYSATAEFEITKKNITKPTLVQSSFVYNGTPQTVALNVINSAYTLEGTYSATNVASYSATVTLTNTTNTQWADGSITALNLPWAITIANGCGTVNIANWAYGDVASNPVLASTCQGIAGAVVTYLGRGTTTYAENANAPTNAGTYTVKAVFPATVNYNAYSATAEFEIWTLEIDKTEIVFNTVEVGNTELNSVTVSLVYLTENIEISLASGVNFSFMKDENFVDNEGGIVNITFAPTVIGEHRDTLFVTSAGITLEVALVGTGSPSTNILVSENAKFVVYPNPNNGEFTIDLSAISGAKTYQIIDAKGAVIYENLVTNTMQQVNFNAVAGRYAVRVFTDSKIYVENIVITQ